MSRIRFRAACVGALGVVAACATGGEPASQRAAPPLTDGEIAGIVVAANTIDAEAGDSAAARATSPEVRAFGKTMGTDHRAVNAQAATLVAQR